MLPRGPDGEQCDEDDAFSWLERRHERLELLHHGRVVATLKGRAATRLADRLERATPAEQQRLLARETGQYRFGNERESKSRGRGQGRGPR